MANKRQQTESVHLDLDHLKPDNQSRAEDRTYGANLRVLRERKGLSQTALAQAMVDSGFTVWRQTTVSRVEQGQRSLLVEEARALEEIVGGGLTTGTGLARTTNQMAVGVVSKQMRFRLARLREEVGELEGMLDALTRAAVRMGQEPLDG